jgi:hypothetical protein
MTKRKTITISLPEAKHRDMKMIAKNRGTTLSGLILKRFYANDTK